MRVACNAIEGEIVWEGELSKKGRITRLWFRRSSLFPLFIVDGPLLRPPGTSTRDISRRNTLKPTDSNCCII